MNNPVEKFRHARETKFSESKIYRHLIRILKFKPPDIGLFYEFLFIYFLYIYNKIMKIVFNISRIYLYNAQYDINKNIKNSEFQFIREFVLFSGEFE